VNNNAAAAAVSADVRGALLFTRSARARAEGGGLSRVRGTWKRENEKCRFCVLSTSLERRTFRDPRRRRDVAFRLGSRRSALSRARTVSRCPKHEAPSTSSDTNTTSWRCRAVLQSVDKSCASSLPRFEIPKVLYSRLLTSLPIPFRLFLPDPDPDLPPLAP